MDMLQKILAFFIVLVRLNIGEDCDEGREKEYHKKVGN